MGFLKSVAYIVVKLSNFVFVRLGNMHVGMAGNVHSVRSISYQLQQWRWWWGWGHCYWGSYERQVLFGEEVEVTFMTWTAILRTGLLWRLHCVRECVQIWSAWTGNTCSWGLSKLMDILGFTPSVCSALKIFLVQCFISVLQTLSCLCVPYSIFDSSHPFTLLSGFVEWFQLASMTISFCWTDINEKNMKIETLAEQMNMIGIPVIFAVYQG